jgi:SAM-dependent methyltransferase
MNSSRDQSIAFWHNRFLQQAAWTRSIRKKIFAMSEVARAETVLEVGSGTGVITKELKELGLANVVGLDLDYKKLQYGQQYAPECTAVAGNGLELPFSDDSIDACVCHFLLLWVSDPLVVVKEMARVTRSKGWVIALAEPDYGGRIDYPATLEGVGELQSASLERQGADPRLGRRLMSLFNETALRDVQAGILGGQWSNDPARRHLMEEEWSVLISDAEVTGNLSEVEAFKRDWFDQGRILYVPTFYALGMVP